MRRGRRAALWAAAVGASTLLLVGAGCRLDAHEPDGLLSMSANGGFYANPLELSIEGAPGTRVFYTLDGSEPDPRYVGNVVADPGQRRQSFEYVGPIPVGTRSTEENLLSAIPSSRVPDPPWAADPPPAWWGGQWRAPAGKVEKATVVRAREFLGDEPAGPTRTETYLVDLPRLAESGLAIVSMSANSADLFGYEHGIYVPGRGFDEREPADAWGGAFGNYSYRGPFWERPAHIEFFEPCGIRGLSAQVGIRIGGQGRGQPMHTVDVYFRSEYGPSQVAYDVFQSGVRTFDRLKLRAGGSVWLSALVTDEVGQTMLRGLVSDSQDWRPVVLFVNGEYWGMHHIRDLYDEQYLARRYGLSDDDLLNLDFYDNTEYESGNGVHYDEMLLFLSEASGGGLAPMSSENFSRASTLLDVDSFIDWQVSMEALGSQVYPNNHNDKRWRLRVPRAPEGAPPRDGRWRWLVFDCDGAFQEVANVAALLENPLSPGIFLKQSEQFRAQFVNRVADFMSTNFRGEVATEHLRQSLATIESEIGPHIARWGYPERDAFDAHWRLFLERAAGRADIVYADVVSYFGRVFDMPLDVGELSVDVSSPSLGRVKVNRVTIDRNLPGADVSPYPWKGRYFTGVPVPITALPNRGCRFVRWEGDVSGTDARTEVVMDGPTTIRAVFALDREVETLE